MVLDDIRNIWSNNEYYDMAEEFMGEQWKCLIWPLIRRCEFSHVVDLAAGHGRNTKALLGIADKVTVVDICQEDLDFCKSRFSEYGDQVDYKLCNGDSIPVESESVTLLYCFDAMVHFEPDTVLNYLKEAKRILKPKGYAFLHHSNYHGRCSVDWRYNPHARNYMSQNLFLYWCGKIGLRVVYSEIVDWCEARNLDCITFVRK